MAVRDGSDPWVAGEVLQAADLNQTFASKLPYSFGTATPSTTDSGFLWYDSNSTPADPKFWDGAAFQALTSGKILQVVRATDATQRSTTSTSYVDANLSLTITPTKSTSAIILIASYLTEVGTGSTTGSVRFRVTDNSDNAISGAEDVISGNPVAGTMTVHMTAFAYATPATTSATTYKTRFRSGTGSTVRLYNDINTGQLFAIEVAA